MVSVVIPVGPGHELYLQDALDSLYMQTFKNWECIIVNDTGKPLPWAAPWVRMLKTKGSIGPAAARNLALNKAKAPLWLALDADDYLVGPTALETMVKAIRDNPGYYVYSDYRRGEEIKQAPDRTCDKINVTMPHIITGLYPVLDNVRFDESLRIAEDWDFAIQMAKTGHCGTRVPTVLSHYREISGSRRKSFTAEDKQIILDKWKDNPVACSKCNDKAKQINNYPQNDVNIPTSGDSVVLVTYIGSEQKRYFTGEGTGRTYAFGTAPQLKEKYVLRDDLSTFVSRPDRFAIPA